MQLAHPTDKFGGLAESCVVHFAVDFFRERALLLCAHINGSAPVPGLPPDLPHAKRATFLPSQHPPPGSPRHESFVM